MRRIFGAMAALMLLAAPGGAPAFAQPGAGTAQPRLSRDFLLGRWTDTNDCSDAVDFNADGSFRTTDGAAGTWRLDGNRLSFIGQRTIVATIGVTGRDSITLTHDDGSVGSSTRCGSTAPAAQRTMPPLPRTAADMIAMSRPFDRPLLIGRWTDDGNCGAVVVFHADGRFTVPGGGGGTWTLVGERLTFTGDQTVGARARAVGDNRILLLHDDGSIGQSIRC